MKLQEALAVVKKVGLSILKDRKAGVECVSVGHKDRSVITNGRDFCITAYVKNKLAASQLSTLGILPIATSMSAHAQSITSVYSRPLGPEDLDVVECGEQFRPLTGLRVPATHRGLYGGTSPVVDAQKWFTTMRVGIGLSNPTNTYPQTLSVGTLGFHVKDPKGKVYLVSNNHVIGRVNSANPGESIVQPGTLDLGANELALMPTLADLEARLRVARVTAHVPLLFPNNLHTPHNRVDAALAELTERIGGELDRLAFGGALRGVAVPILDSTTGAIQGSGRVHKLGRTTGFTEGKIVGLGGQSLVTYEPGSAYFIDQIVVQATEDNVGPFSASGDSGSAVLNDLHEVVGLLFAGTRHQTLVNPITFVLDELTTASKLTKLTLVHAARP